MPRYFVETRVTVQVAEAPSAEEAARAAVKNTNPDFLGPAVSMWELRPDERSEFRVGVIVNVEPVS